MAHHHPRIIDITRHRDAGPAERQEDIVHWEVAYGWGTLPVDDIRALCADAVAAATAQPDQDPPPPATQVHVRNGDLPPDHPHPDSPDYHERWDLPAAGAATHEPYVTITIGHDPDGGGDGRGLYEITQAGRTDRRRDATTATLVAAHRTIAAAVALAQAELAAVSARCHLDPADERAEPA